MFTKLSLVLGYFQVGWNVLTEVKDLVEIIEEADPDDGNSTGPKKKQAVLDLIGAVYDAGNDIIDLPISKEVITKLASNAVDIFVDLFNVIGRFQKSKDAA